MSTTAALTVTVETLDAMEEEHEEGIASWGDDPDEPSEVANASVLFDLLVTAAQEVAS